MVLYFINSTVFYPVEFGDPIVLYSIQQSFGI
jgi:hypothetical protein